MKYIKYIVLGVIIVVALVCGAVSVGTVSAGQEGVRTRLGAVVGIVPPGLYFQTPFIEGTIPMDVQTQKEQTAASAASSDLQTVNAEVAVNYNVNPDAVADIYSRLGRDYSSRVIDPAIQEVVKAVTAKYTAEQLITQRAQVTTDIQTALTARLQVYDIVVTTVSITNFDFSKQFNEAIESKVTAQQNAEAAKNKLAQVQYEAQQTVAKATADAEAIRIQTQAIQSGGGQAYVQLQAIKVQQSAVEKWNGALPTQMIPGGAVPFLNLSK
jgi:regulator of protease activity HflC (stomatin/prohibitin superfamily)